MKKQLQIYLEKRCMEFVSDTNIKKCEKADLKAALMKERNAEIVNVRAKGKIVSVQFNQEEKVVHYTVHLQFFIKQNQNFYIEEEIEKRVAHFYKGEHVVDEEVKLETENEEAWSELKYETTMRAPFYYNRLKAVQYADAWWNEYNPAYQKFEVDCTNFVSQCLRAGGAPMRGAPNRSSGWWYSGKTWSYSWAVAHAMNLYLQNSTIGLRAKRVETAGELLLGDIICYDFEGDGRFNHNTIVTAKDEFGMPLVNAHTTNSRHRYWSYVDSTAYTPNIQYRFYSIVDDA